jgi:hypothetical protein
VRLHVSLLALVLPLVLTTTDRKPGSGEERPAAGPIVADVETTQFKVYRCAPAAEIVDSRRLGRGGGELRAGPHRLVVPRDAIPATRRVTLREHAGDYLVVSLQPSGQPFERSVTIVLSTQRCGTQDEPPVGAIRYTAATGWTRVDPAAISVAAGAGPGEFEVSIESQGFSSYALISP